MPTKKTIHVPPLPLPVKPKAARKKAVPKPKEKPAPIDPDRIAVIRDTREKKGKGWWFPESELCSGTIARKLDTGDYCLEGYEEIFTVDRKGSITEFASNLFQKRFERELERMKTFKLAVVLLEFEFEDLARWPSSSSLPASRIRRIRTTKNSLLKRFWELKIKYPHVEFLFAGPYGKWAVTSLFKRAIELYGS